MASKRAIIAQAVADALSGASGTVPLLNQTFTVSRKAVPGNELENLTGLTLTVVTPGHERRTLSTRSSVQKLFAVEIGIQKRLSRDCNPESPDGNDEFDALMEFAEAVALYFQPDGTAGGQIGNKLAWWAEDGNEISPYDMEHLRQLRVFTSYVTLSLRYF
jgi:hypothetical protein